MTKVRRFAAARPIRRCLTGRGLAPAHIGRFVPLRLPRLKTRPVSLLEQEFAAMMGAKYALWCLAVRRTFLVPQGARSAENARVLIRVHLCRRAVFRCPCGLRCRFLPNASGDNYRIDMVDFDPSADVDTDFACAVTHRHGAIMNLCTAADIPVIEDAQSWHHMEQTQDRHDWRIGCL
jgi:hypothetical protein